MKFTIGGHVHVANFGKGIVREVRNGGRYLVELKGRLMVAAEAQLTPVERPTPQPRDRSPAPPEVPAHLARQHVPTSIDLHGKTTDEAVAAMDAFLDAAILASHAEVRIIHGRSGGKLKVAVHERLRAIAAVHSFGVDERNPGVTIVLL